MPEVTITITDTALGGLTILSDPPAAELGPRYQNGDASPAQTVALMALTHMAQHTQGMHHPESPIIVVSSLPKLEIVR